jgi:hypothetical protein
MIWSSSLNQKTVLIKHMCHEPELPLVFFKHFDLVPVSKSESEDVMFFSRPRTPVCAISMLSVECYAKSQSHVVASNMCEKTLAFN